MYKCKQSIILEDNFGVDHQFLKGHKYSLEDSTEENIYGIGFGYITISKKSCYFISQDKIDKYFKWEEPVYATGSFGGKRFTYSSID
ncbi:hypothetical protein ACH6EH_07045 [Paenibacillus sp. JSM ZJ436]|uniref:hypothetical protein n=1 Tax=Paenibacillus sp. JSM ZJ436 TaxID=3376190 RepID=UPI003791B8C4